jgi:hypothetical protein
MHTEPLLPWPLQLFAASLLVTFLAWVVYLIRQKRLGLRDSLIWLLSTLAALVVTVFPGILESAAAALDIVVPSNALFALAFVYILLNLLSLTLTASADSTRVRRLCQECAMLRAEIDELRRTRSPA